MRTAQVHQVCMGMITPEEIRSLNQYLSNEKQDDFAMVHHGSDMIDMDDLIEAIQHKHEFDANDKQNFG